MSSIAVASVGRESAPPAPWLTTHSCECTASKAAKPFSFSWTAKIDLQYVFNAKMRYTRQTTISQEKDLLN